MNWRKTLFRLHGWLGLNIGLLLFVVCFSGSFATLSHEMDWLLNPAMRCEARNEPYDWTAMHHTLVDAFPDGVTSGIYAPIDRGFAALAYVSSINGQTRKAYLDPYTGRLQGHTNFFNVQRFFRTFHRRFFDGKRGIIIVTLTAFMLLASGLSGFCFYKGWVKQLFAVRRDRGPRRLWSDLHKTAGIWTLLFSLLMAFTGVFYFVEVCFQSAGNYKALLPPPLPKLDKASLAGYGPQPALLRPNEYAELAREAFPGLEIRSVRMPTRVGSPVYLDGQTGNPLLRDRANKVLLHPFTGEVIAMQRGSQLAAVPFITDLVDPLHFGYFGGLWAKILWFVFGLTLSLSILAGAYLWVVRSTPRRNAGVGSASIWSRGVVVSFTFTLAYFAVVLCSTVEGIQRYGKQDAPPSAIAEQFIGPYRVRVSCARPCNPTEGLQLSARFLGKGFPNYKQVSIGESEGERTTMKGTAFAPEASLTTEPDTTLRLRITMWDDVTYEAVFKVPDLIETLPGTGARLPDTPPGVWWTIAIFSALTVGAMAGWLCFILRAFRTAFRRKTRFQETEKQAIGAS